jgi:hypothetical protein
MRKIFIVVILIIYAGLAFACLNMPQIATAQMELPTNTNITLLNETVTNNTVPDATNEATRMDENAKPWCHFQIALHKHNITVLEPELIKGEITRYVGKKNAKVYGRTNSGEGAVLVRIKPTRIIAEKDIAKLDWYFERRNKTMADIPDWVVFQANTLANLESWTEFSGIQIEYSLIERTSERELLPIANADDVGITACLH